MFRCASVIAPVPPWAWNQPEVHVYLLLLSRACPLPRRKVYGPVGSSMPVMLPRLVICGRRVVSARAASSDIWTPFAVCLHRRNRGLSAISSFRGKRNCFSPGAIRRRNNCSGDVKEEAAMQARSVAWLEGCKGAGKVVERRGKGSRAARARAIIWQKDCQKQRSNQPKEGTLWPSPH